MCLILVSFLFHYNSSSDKLNADMHEEDFTANEQAEKEEEVDVYAQTKPFCQQKIALQRLKFTHSASMASVPSISPATTPPLPMLSPTQAAAATSAKVLNKQQKEQQQQQHHQSPIKITSTTTGQPTLSEHAGATYQQQQQQPPHRLHAYRIAQQSQAEQMISAAGVSASVAAAYKRQQQKLRKLHELHSLALEGGDTARGYCSCDEQWTSSSPTTSGSPTLSCTEGHEKTSDGSEGNETATVAAVKRERVTGNAYKQMNVTTGHGRLAVGGNDAGHSRTWQPPNRTNNTAKNNSNDGGGNIWSGTRANEVAKAAAAVVAAKAAASASATSTATATTTASMSAGALRPVPAVRLKQQHHVRFSDEKNFSD
ncbi:transcription factor kayak-like [Bactrocera tryoni]|uniref:transcription factor kayak-like n=1 Tax=Bactrocera tryoni TaxID=59916 RepID=UPI001A97C2E8|nr:transcription factor kayak-like [Bactrocera tryoni]